MGGFSYASLEPVVYASSVKQVSTGGNLAHWNPSLEVLKAYHTFILLELIHSFIETLLFY